MAQELQVITKAKKLAIHTIKLTSNCNHFPKKFRYSVVDKMNRKCLDIYETLMEANQTNLERNAKFLNGFQGVLAKQNLIEQRK